MKEGFKPKTEPIRDKNGLLMYNKTEIMNTYKEYFEQLLNQNQNMDYNKEENVENGDGEEEKIPEDWERSIIYPIFKKGYKLTCNNYRGISLLSTAYKTLTRILKKRLDPHIEEIIGEYQSVF
jgi:hypothetical protein